MSLRSQTAEMSAASSGAIALTPKTKASPKKKFRKKKRSSAPKQEASVNKAHLKDTSPLTESKKIVKVISPAPKKAGGESASPSVEPKKAIGKVSPPAKKSFADASASHPSMTTSEGKDIRFLVDSQSNYPMTLKNLLSCIGIINTSPGLNNLVFVRRVARVDQVKLKGGFAIFALASSEMKTTPLRVNDIDFEMIYNRRSRVIQLLDAYHFSIKKDAPEQHFFNVDMRFSQEITGYDDSIACRDFLGEITFADGEYKSHDPFDWTRMRLSVDSEGKIFVAPEDAALVAKVRAQLAKGEFGVDWDLFVRPETSNGIGRLTKYLYQLEFSDYRLTVPKNDGQIPLEQIESYLRNRKDIGTLYRNLIEIAQQLFNVNAAKNSTELPALPAWIEYNERWLTILDGLSRSIAYEIISRAPVIIGDAEKKALAAKFATDLQADIAERVQSKKLTYPLDIPYTLMENFAQGFVCSYLRSQSLQVGSPAKVEEKKDGDKKSEVAKIVTSAETGPITDKSPAMTPSLRSSASGDDSSKVSGGEALFSPTQTAKVVTGSASGTGASPSIVTGPRQSA